MKYSSRLLLSIATVAAACAAPTSAAPGIISLPGGGQLNVPVKSLTDLRFVNVVRQTRDLSCGAAAVATLMNHAYGIPVTEPQIITAILEQVPEDSRSRIAAEGFSLLELKRFLESRGFVAGGFKMESVEKLKNLQVPVIALVNVRGYNHFVVIKKVENGRVLIADPAFGNTRPTLDAFQGQWNGIILAVVLQGATPNIEFTGDPTIRARPSDLRSISVALGTAEITLEGEY